MHRSTQLREQKKLNSLPFYTAYELLKAPMLNADPDAIEEKDEIDEIRSCLQNEKDFFCLTQEILRLIFEEKAIERLLQYCFKKNIITKENFAIFFHSTAKNMNEKAIDFLLLSDKQNVWLTINDLEATINVVLQSVEETKEVMKMGEAVEIRKLHMIRSKHYLDKIIIPIRHEIQRRKELAVFAILNKTSPDSKIDLTEYVKTLTSLTVKGELHHFFRHVHQMQKLENLTFQDCTIAPTHSKPTQKMSVKILCLINIRKDFFLAFLKIANHFLNGATLLNLHISFKESPESISSDEIKAITQLFPNLNVIKFGNVRFQDTNRINEFILSIDQGLLHEKLAFNNGSTSLKKLDLSEISSDLRVCTLNYDLIKWMIPMLERADFQLILPPAVGIKEDFSIFLSLSHFYSERNTRLELIDSVIPVKNVRTLINSYVRDLGDDLLNLIPKKYQHTIIISRKNTSKNKFHYEIQMTDEDSVILELLLSSLNHMIPKIFNTSVVTTVMDEKKLKSILIEDRPLIEAIVRWNVDCKKEVGQGLSARIDTAYYRKNKALSTEIKHLRGELESCSRQYDMSFFPSIYSAKTKSQLLDVKNLMKPRVIELENKRRLEDYRQKAIDYVMRLRLRNIQNPIQALNHCENEREIYERIDNTVRAEEKNAASQNALIDNILDRIDIDKVIEDLPEAKFELNERNRHHPRRLMEQKFVYVVEYCLCRLSPKLYEYLPEFFNNAELKNSKQQRMTPALKDVIKDFLEPINEFLKEIKQDRFAKQIRNELFTIEGLKFFFENKSRFLQRIMHLQRRPLWTNHDPVSYFLTPPDGLVPQAQLPAVLRS